MFCVLSCSLGGKRIPSARANIDAINHKEAVASSTKNNKARSRAARHPLMEGASMQSVASHYALAMIRGVTGL
jgi:hypothetical protein